MKLRIINPDGDPYKTKVVDAETGKELEFVTRIEFFQIAGGDPRLIIELDAASIDLQMEGEVKKT